MPRSRHCAGSAYVAASPGIVAWNAVSKQATDGTDGSAARTASSPASDAGRCSGASSTTASSSALTRSSTTTAEVNAAPPCTIRCPTQSTPDSPASLPTASPTSDGSSVDGAPRSAEPVSSVPSSSRSLTELDPYRRRAPSSGRRHRVLAAGRLVVVAASSARPPMVPTRLPAASYGHDHPLTSGWSSPCSRVQAGPPVARRPSAAPAGLPRRQPRHPVDDVDDEAEAVEVVEHHHVERRRGGALLLEPAHVHVGGWSGGRSAGG